MPPLITRGLGFSPHYIVTGGYLAGSAPATATDLISAIVAQLRAWNAGALVTALGETSSVKKIWVDEAQGSPDPPWIRINEQTEPQTPDSIDANGDRQFFSTNCSLQIDIFATKKTSARSIRTQVYQALSDQTLANDDCTVLSFMPSENQFPIVSEPGVTSPVFYHAIASFTYFVGRQYT